MTNHMGVLSGTFSRFGAGGNIKRLSCISNMLIVRRAVMLRTCLQETRSLQLPKVSFSSLCHPLIKTTFQIHNHWLCVDRQPLPFSSFRTLIVRISCASKERSRSSLGADLSARNRIPVQTGASGRPGCTRSLCYSAARSRTPRNWSP
jgi:hypothetical protein